MEKQKFLDTVNHYVKLHSLILDSKFNSIEEAYQDSTNKNTPIDFLNTYFSIKKVEEVIDFNKFIPSFKKAFPKEDFKLNSNNVFSNERTKILFEGYSQAFIFKENNTLELYFSGTYGWRFTSVKTGQGIKHPEFENNSDMNKAIEWANKNGYFVVESEED